MHQNEFEYWEYVDMPDDMYEPLFYDCQHIMIDGNLYVVTVYVHDDGQIEVDHTRALYTCWDGTLPF